ncbi:DUF1330 domain-containing protein [Nonomuraea sp. NPDC047529]|uniref:DUF1330 domain-containing protein n=1 Tax=Nonomuraea sp. NPDC047529 TaxID=3155623 RepID=UPI0033F8E8EA
MAYVLTHLQKAAPHPEIAEYIERLPATFEPYGGRYLVHATQHEVKEGSWPGHVVRLGFQGRPRRGRGGTLSRTGRSHGCAHAPSRPTSSWSTACPRTTSQGGRQRPTGGDDLACIGHRRLLPVSLLLRVYGCWSYTTAGRAGSTSEPAVTAAPWCGGHERKPRRVPAGSRQPYRQRCIWALCTGCSPRPATGTPRRTWHDCPR